MTTLQSEDAAREFVAQRCDERSLASLAWFASELESANQSQNLVSKRSLPAVWLRHIADSAQLLDHVSRETRLWLDLGTGAGFPGLILAIMRPAIEFKLVESRSLRIQWLAHVVDHLALDNCEVVGTDVRAMAQCSADAISARAFAPLDRLIALSARFSTASSHWVLPKGRSASQEVARLPLALQSMFHVKHSVTDAEAGIVVGTGKVEIAG